MPRKKEFADKYASEDFLRALRGKLGFLNMKQGELAVIIGVSPATMSGRMSRPETFTVAELRKLIAATDMEPVELLKLLGVTQKDLRRHGLAEREGG